MCQYQAISQLLPPFLTKTDEAIFDANMTNYSQFITKSNFNNKLFSIYHEMRFQKQVTLPPHKQTLLIAQPTP